MTPGLNMDIDHLWECAIYYSIDGFGEFVPTFAGIIIGQQVGAAKMPRQQVGASDSETHRS